MRSLIYISLLCVCLPAHAAEVDVPMTVKIENLTDRPLEEAIAYCDERNLPCPELRAQYDPITEVQFEQPWEIEPSAGEQINVE